MAGYSGTPLLKKLGYREGRRALFSALPQDLEMLATGPGFASVDRLETLDDPIPAGPYDVIHVFEKKREILEKKLPDLRAALDPSGMIWVSWPKKASGVKTTLHGNVVRTLILAAGLVDIKVCAVDAIWSGLKVVIPVADRP